MNTTQFNELCNYLGNTNVQPKIEEQQNLVGENKNKMIKNERKNLETDNKNSAHYNMSELQIIKLVDEGLYPETFDDEKDTIQEERYQNLLKRYASINDIKIFQEFPDDAHQQLDALKHKYPHCLDIIEMIDTQIYLQERSDMPYAKIPHLIFNGEPGSGKTSLAKHIAEIISPQYYYLDLSLYTEAFQLVGTSMGYNNGDCGLLIKNCSESHYANNIFICDEAEKAQQSSERTSPLVPLYQLLEEDSAKTFTDVAMQIPVDMSHNSFILTTNDVTLLPEAIQSRCLIFDIPVPSKKYWLNTLCSVCGKTY